VADISKHCHFQVSSLRKKERKKERTEVTNQIKEEKVENTR